METRKYLWEILDEYFKDDKLRKDWASPGGSDIKTFLEITKAIMLVGFEITDDIIRSEETGKSHIAIYGLKINKKSREISWYILTFGSMYFMSEYWSNIEHEIAEIRKKYDII